MSKNTNKNIILTSTGFSNQKAEDFLLESIEKKGLSKKVAIITTAAEGKEEHKYSKLAYSQFEEMGFSRITFFDFESDDIQKLSETPVIYVCGGDTYRLLRSARNQDFDEFLTEFLENNGLYIGVSAGSLILTPSICTSDSKPEDYSDEGLVGFKVLSYLIRAHAQEFKVENTGGGTPVLNLPDDHVVLTSPAEGVENIRLLTP